MKRLVVDEEAACEVHATLAKRDTHLSKIVAATVDAIADGSCEWRVPITHSTIYRIEGIYRLAAASGAVLYPEIAGDLSNREKIFLQAYLDQGLGGTGSDAPLRSRLEEVMAGCGELLSASIRVRHLLRQSSCPSLDRIDSAVLIGAYGGDHVGDAAILGGVLRTLENDLGVSKAHLMSHRADHTRRLAAGIETQVELSVHDYSIRRVDELLKRADALILAGGPLMDLPRVLAKHFAASCSARCHDRPFIIERVGVGPFRRRASRILARLIAKSACSISVRSKAAASDPILEGLEVEEGRDPAFDYLAARTDSTLLTDEDRDSVDSLLDGTEGRLCIGINLRPIRREWGDETRDATHSVYEGFLDRLARGLVQLAQQSPRPISFIFFPMNPSPVGMSDLASAWSLHRRIGDQADLRVWEADPDVEGVLYLLKRLDAAITMRLHACIFSLCSGLPVYGIDYYPGQVGKVSQLFADLERSENACRIDTFDPSRFVDRVTWLAWGSEST